MRTVVQALEDAAASTTTGFRFVEDKTGAEPFFPYGEIARAAARYGGAMQALGLGVGDRIALILPDNQDFVWAFFGALQAGIIPVPIYPPAGLRRLEGYLQNTLHIVVKSGAKVLLTDALVKKLLGTIQLQAPELAQVVEVEPLRSADAPLRPEKITLDHTCFLQFTSGSTSAPKGVVVTHGNIAANEHAIMDLGLRVGEEDSAVSWLPLYHDMGLIGFVLAPMYHQRPITFMPPLRFLRRPGSWLKAMSRHRATISFGPNFAYALCVKRTKPEDLEGLDLSSWRVAGCGAEPVRAENLLAFADKFANVGFDRRAFMPCYGMAESTLAISFARRWDGVYTDVIDVAQLADGRAEPCAPDQDGALHVVGCGPPFADHEIAVFAPDDDRSEHPLGERDVGEIRLAGPSVTTGYFNDPELSAQLFAGRWLRTGDLGYLADGEVYICGRSKELIIVNGRNYYPQDLEWEASQVEGVRKGNAVAFGTHDTAKDRERIVIAFETATKGEQRGALGPQVRRAVQQATGLVVDEVVPLDPGVLPKTSSGKLKRGETRALYEAEQLGSRASIRKADPVGVAKQFAKSQLSYARHALFGMPKKRRGSGGEGAGPTS